MTEAHPARSRMQLVPHWARAAVDLDGTPNPRGPAFAFGWSRQSPAAAAEHALERARRHAENLKSALNDDDGLDLDPQGYYVGERPLREPIIEAFDDAEGMVAAITRNSQGVLVLNTAQVMFIDIDLPEPRPGRRGPTGTRPGFFRRLFGKAPAPAPELVDDTVARVEAEVARRPGLGLRLYRTRRGYRGLVTSHVFDPLSDESRDLLNTLGNDPLYQRLCEVQRCYRARLSPKPWRVGLKNVPFSFFPWQASPKRTRAFEAWEARYRAACAPVSVCRLVAELGDPTVHPAVVPWIALHDHWCCTGRDVLA